MKEFCMECGEEEVACHCETGFKICQVGEWREDKMPKWNDGKPRMVPVLVNRSEYEEYRAYKKENPTVTWTDITKSFRELQDRLEELFGETKEEKAERKRINKEIELEHHRAWKRARLMGKIND